MKTDAHPSHHYMSRRFGNSSTQRCRGDTSKRAFTLVELLVVFAILALLAVMSLPALSRANIKSHALQCVSNTKMLTAAWLMYSVENNDQLIPATSWVTDSSANSSSTDFIDLGNKLLANALSPYLRGNVKVYRCPSDPRTSTLVGHLGKPPARSYSMNNHIGTYFSSNYAYSQFSKLSKFNRPGPANTFVFLDEGLSINDGFFTVSLAGFDPRNPAQQDAFGFGSTPASYHHRAGSFSFADGHAELHKWKQFSATTPPSADDVDWLQSKTTAKINNPTR